MGFDYIEKIMNLPLINTRNKAAPKAPHPLAQSAPSLEEFGLGIQVFKIEATKATEANHLQPRKFMKNIENPNYYQPEPLPKRIQVLPSLSCEKRDKAMFLESTSVQRRTGIERKKPSGVVDIIKEVEYKPQVNKKISSAQQTVKASPSEQQSLPQEQEIIQPHYRVSFNELTNFYADFRQSETDNIKEIKRLRKLKENVDNQELERAMRLKDNKKELIEQMVEKQELGCFFNEEIYEQFQISTFMDNGQCFRFQDQELPLQDEEVDYDQ